MAYLLRARLPDDVIFKITKDCFGVFMKERMAKGWSKIHDEMMWRNKHHYSCTHHFCDVSECNCYRRFPFYLLRHVDANCWACGKGETRQAFCPALDMVETEGSPAIWIDFDANEIGMMNSMTSIFDDDTHPTEWSLHYTQVVHYTMELHAADPLVPSW